jgi:hypothetical protein
MSCCAFPLFVIPTLVPGIAPNAGVGGDARDRPVHDVFGFERS